MKFNNLVLSFLIGLTLQQPLFASESIDGLKSESAGLCEVDESFTDPADDILSKMINHISDAQLLANRRLDYVSKTWKKILEEARIKRIKAIIVHNMEKVEDGNEYIFNFDLKRNFLRLAGVKAKKSESGYSVSFIPIGAEPIPAEGGYLSRHLEMDLPTKCSNAMWDYIEPPCLVFLGGGGKTLPDITRPKVFLFYGTFTLLNGTKYVFFEYHGDKADRNLPNYGKPVIREISTEGFSASREYADKRFSFSALMDSIKNPETPRVINLGLYPEVDKEIYPTNYWLKFNDFGYINH